MNEPAAPSGILCLGLRAAVYPSRSNAVQDRPTPSDNLAFQGEDRINVDLVDAAGNRIQRTLALPEPGLVIDTEPPPPPDTLRITHERFPWGSDATGNGEHAFVRGAEHAVAPSSYVLVVDRPDLRAASVLGSSTSEPDGSIVRFELDRREDGPSVYVAVLDAAGNGSAGSTGGPRVARRVQKGEWTASLRGKIPTPIARTPTTPSRSWAVSHPRCSNPQKKSSR